MLKGSEVRSVQRLLTALPPVRRPPPLTVGHIVKGACPGSELDPETTGPVVDEPDTIASTPDCRTTPDANGDEEEEEEEEAEDVGDESVAADGDPKELTATVLLIPLLLDEEVEEEEDDDDDDDAEEDEDDDGVEDLVALPVDVTGTDTDTSGHGGTVRRDPTRGLILYRNIANGLIRWGFYLTVRDEILVIVTAQLACFGELRSNRRARAYAFPDVGADVKAYRGTPLTTGNASPFGVIRDGSVLVHMT
uniref:Uncharacterized protein n=1 Tax=Anopheles culicifacies TaxID=139723 RepID=A0A182MWJ2_9DIPT